MAQFALIGVKKFRLRRLTSDRLRLCPRPRANFSDPLIALHVQNLRLRRCGAFFENRICFENRLLNFTMIKKLLTG